MRRTAPAFPRRSLLAAIACVALSGPVPAVATPGSAVTLPRSLDGASVTYDARFHREPFNSSAVADGAATLRLKVDGDASITDAGGGTQPARTYTFHATGLADLATQQWEALDGIVRYALDPVTGLPVQTHIDADLDWTSVSNPRLEYRFTANVGPDLLDMPDTLLPLVRFLDALPGRTYREGEHIVGGPGPAMFATAGKIEQVDLSLPDSRGVIRPGERVDALPVSFVLRPVAGVEVSGVVYLQDGAALPAKLTLRYHALTMVRDLATFDLVRTDRGEGDPLPDVPAFRHPASHPDAELAPPLATGTRTPSWTTHPKVEDVVALSAATPAVEAYRAQYPGAFVAAVIDQHGHREVRAAAGGVPAVRDRLESTLQRPFWIVQWYADENPGVVLNSVVIPNAASGEHEAFTQAGGGFPPTTHPDHTLTSTSAIDLSERLVPALADDGASEAVVLYAAAPNWWIQQRGAGVDAETLAEDPSRMFDLLHPWMPQACFVWPPTPGATALLDGEGGILLGSIEARYLSPRVAGTEPTAECGKRLAGLVIDPTDPSELNGLLSDVEMAVERVSTYADTTRQPHAPIRILSDADFDGPRAVSGVVGGTGTRDDPYVISGWNIQPASDAAPAITLENTTKHVLVTGNTVHGDGGIGVLASKAKNVRVEKNSLLGLGAGVAVTGLTGGVIAENVATGVGSGIHVQNHLALDPDTLAVTAIPVIDLEIRDNSVDRAVAAISYFGSYGTLRDNRILGNTLSRSHWGLYAAEPEHTVLRGNRYNANTIGALAAGRGTGVRLEDEVFASSGLVGLALASRGVTVEGGRFEDTDGYALGAAGADAAIAGARFDKNVRGIVALTGSQLSVSGASFTRNEEFGAYADLATIDARNSWWGATDGPGGCAEGSGDRVSCDVAALPFRVDAP